MAITRFAPSPTGYLHIGGLRTALYSYLWAKKTNGEFKLRIEDTDQARNSEDAVKAIIEAFDWVGMDSDCEVEYQSKRGDIYTKYINQLLDEGKAYKCYMSRDELDQLRATQEANKETPKVEEIKIQEKPSEPMVESILKNNELETDESVENSTEMPSTIQVAQMTATSGDASVVLEQPQILSSKQMTDCPECKTDLVKQEGCVLCPDCGWSACSH